MLEAQFNWLITTDPSVKRIIDETDPNNVYIGICQSKNSISDEWSEQWLIQKITKVGAITKTGLLPWGIYAWNNVWTDRASYSYS